MKCFPDISLVINRSFWDCGVGKQPIIMDAPLFKSEPNSIYFRQDLNQTSVRTWCPSKMSRKCPSGLSARVICVSASRIFCICETSPTMEAEFQPFRAEIVADVWHKSQISQQTGDWFPHSLVHAYRHIKLVPLRLHDHKLEAHLMENSTTHQAY